MPQDEIHQAFEESFQNPLIIATRVGVLEAAGPTLSAVADVTRAAGQIKQDPKLLAVALLCRISSELADGIGLVCRRSRAYAGGCLLRQLIEVEYLMFVGYNDPGTLTKWHQADSEELRKTFTPQRMRNSSAGLFQDKEYWRHCEIGGHPHPKFSRILLPTYQSKWEPLAFLLPDAAHHVRRLWTSLRLLLPPLGIDLSEVEIALLEALHNWEEVENPVVLSFDGIELPA